ncbi:DUF6157 family protein [Larkinella terrae]|uniref:Uncharacterized protein n=1 Tax=Larkinella terrae TaxID=2025311 RepID=A0A7K0EMB8_9BACT|nr:DUF6157 family protein [Larkinella terrae]MRS63003.1 hypothetical protein [Larkinella terrae]
MKTHTTNYTNTLIEVAADSPASFGETPPVKGEARSVANIQFDMIKKHPYQYTSDDVVFQCYATKKDLAASELPAERERFFSKGQPCLRASPLTKRYGWGVHNNAEGKVAVYAVDSDEYKALSLDKNLTKVKAMRSKKA